MEWFNYVKKIGFSLDRETQTDLEYSATLEKSRVGQFVLELEKLLTIPFKLSFLNAVNSDYLEINEECNTEEEVKNVLDDYVFEENVEIALFIKKENLVKDFHLGEEVSKLIFLKIESFLNLFEDNSFEGFEQNFLTKGKNFCLIILIDSQISFSNGLITVTNINDLNNVNFDKEKFHRAQRLSFNRTSSMQRGDNLIISPEHLYFPDNDGEIQFLFNKWFCKLTLTYLAKQIHFNPEDQTYEYIFSGLKILRLNSHVTIDKRHNSNLKYLFGLYAWLYDSENVLDKSALLQNVFTTHLKNSDVDINKVLDHSRTLYDVIIDNFQVYLKDSMDEYLVKRKEIENLVQVNSVEITNQINNLTSIMTKNLFGVLAAGITAVIGFTEDQNLGVMPYILYVYSAFVLLLTFYYSYFAKININAQVKHFDNKINEYKIFFSEESLASLIGNLIPRKKKIYGRYQIITWSINLTIVLAAIFLGIYIQTEGRILYDIYTLISWFIFICL
ncbi:hypothetical protein EIJ82_00275 [Alkalihalobacillus clausii]|nr:hypothetical protein [Shouchella clausii]